MKKISQLEVGKINFDKGVRSKKEKKFIHP